jgi:hypothetical protein
MARKDPPPSNPPSPELPELVPVVFSPPPGADPIPPIQVRRQDVPSIVEALTHGNRAAAALEYVRLITAALPSSSPVTSADAGPAFQAWLTARAIATRFGLPLDALRKRLQRYRQDSDRGWKTAENRTARTEKYLYLVSSIWHIIEAMPRA